MNEANAVHAGDAGSALNLSAAQRRNLAQAAFGILERLEIRRDSAPIHGPTPAGLIERLMQAPGESGSTLTCVVEMIDAAVATGWNKSHAGDLSYIPSGGIFAGAVAALLAAGAHAYTGAAFGAPALVAMEESVLHWLAALLEMPASTEGLLLSGGSLANQTAIVTARERRYDARQSRVYLSDRAHHSLQKALRLCGIASDRICTVRSGDGGGIDISQLSRQLEQDNAAGLAPWLVIGSAGTTDTGSVDDLVALRQLSTVHGAWFHVDAAYGGMFALTQRGKARMRGIGDADSVTIDAHKGLMLPYGVGALLVREPGAMAAAHSGVGGYMRDVPASEELPNYFERGPELTRPCRGLLAWLPLHLHGVGAFRAALDQCLDLAEQAASRLRSVEGILVLQDPTLSVVAFRSRAGNPATESMLGALNASGSLYVSSTVINEFTYIRLAFLNARSGIREIDCVLHIVSRFGQITAD